MADRYKSPDNPVIGALTGWSKLTTNRTDGKPVEGDHGFTVPDLLRLVKALRAEFSPARLAEIEELIARHVSRKDNPHETDLLKMGTSVINELYKVWRENGHTDGSMDEFLSVIFQYVRIADIETTREGIAEDQVVTALGLFTVVNDHNEDPDAHAAMFSKLFPGSPVLAYPTYSLTGYLGLPADVEVTRNGELTVMSSTGQLKVLGKNTLSEDYSLGQPAFPIFGAVTNLVTESEAINNADVWSVENATVNNAPSIISPRNMSSTCLAIRETAMPTPAVHGIQYKGPNIAITKGKWYTISAFVAPNGRKAFGIEPFDAYTEAQIPTAANPYRYMHFNLETGETFASPDAPGHYGHVYDLGNGWKRVQLTFKAASSTNLVFRMYSLDIFDGDGTHEGVTNAGVALFGIMVTETPYITPYVPSLGNRGTLAATTVRIPIGAWYRGDAGAIITTLNNPFPDRNGIVSEIYNFANENKNITHVARFPADGSGRIYLTGYGVNNQILASSYTAKTYDDWQMCMHSYSTSEHLFGGRENDTVIKNVTGQANPDAKYIYLGCNRNRRSILNGYIRSLIYYPEYLIPENMPFFNSLEPYTYVAEEED